MTLSNPEIITKIEEEEALLENCDTFSQRFDYLNNILQFKLLLNPIPENAIYRDLKLLIKYYSKSLEEKHFQYDSISLSFIEAYLDYIDIEKKISLLKFTIRVFKIQGYDDLDELESLLNKHELNFCLRKKNIKNVVKYIHLWSIQSWRTITLSIAIMFTISCIILLPAPTCSVTLFNIEYIEISNNFYVNHILNTLIGITGIDDRFKVTPINPFAVIVCVLGRLAFLFLIIGILVEQLIKKLKI